MDSKPITITHLTPKQKSMLEKMWATQSLDDLYEYQLSLPPDDLRLSISLVELLKVESIDQIQQETAQYTEAQQIIQKVKNSC